MNDLKFAFRQLLKNPGFTAVAVLTLALGIGANTAIFCVVNGVLLKPLPYREQERLVRLWHNKPEAGMRGMPVTAGNVNLWRSQAQSFEEVAAFSTTASVITGAAEPKQITGARVTHNLLAMLGYQPLIGRSFLPEENRPGSPNVVLLSHNLWQRRFGGNPAVLGSTITLDHTNTFTVVGVMPVEASFPDKSEFWLPEQATASDGHGMRGLLVIALLKSGVTSMMAQNELTLINRQLQKLFPDDYAGWDAEVKPLHESVVGHVRKALLVLFGAVGFVLLIACANLGNLLLARGAARRKEIAMRAALGASGGRLMRQLLTESTLLAFLGGAAGVLLAYWAVQGMIAFHPPDVPRLEEVKMDVRVLAFTFFSTLLVGLVSGLAPALHVFKADLNPVLKDGAASAFSGGRWLRNFGLRDVTVSMQTALAVVLLVGAGLLMKSLVKLRQVELGFTPANVISVTLSPPFNLFPKQQRTSDYYRQLLDSLKAAPGVEAAAVVTGAPTLGAFMNVAVLIAGRPAPPAADTQRAFLTVVSADYFCAIGNPLRQGRGFTDHDDEGGPLVAIINETMARRYFPSANPLGQRIAVQGERDTWMEVVGVAADVKQFGLDQENKPAFYQPYRQREAKFMNLAVRIVADPATMIPTLRSRIFEVNKFTAITRIRTLEQMVSDAVAQPRFYTLLMALFASIALALAALGIYGVIAYSVNRRRREIGLRMALGAPRRSVVSLVIAQGVTLALIGVGVGVGAALVLTRFLRSLLFEVTPSDPLTFAGVSLLLVVIALFACWLPARRASRVDPMTALRTE